MEKSYRGWIRWESKNTCILPNWVILVFGMVNIASEKVQMWVQVEVLLSLALSARFTNSSKRGLQ